MTKLTIRSHPRGRGQMCGLDSIFFKIIKKEKRSHPNFIQPELGLSFIDMVLSLFGIDKNRYNRSYHLTLVICQIIPGCTFTKMKVTLLSLIHLIFILISRATLMKSYGLNYCKVIHRLEFMTIRIHLSMMK